MSNYREQIRDNSYSMEDVSDIPNTEVVTCDFVELLCDSIETEIHDAISDLEHIQGLIEIDDIKEKLKELVKQLY